MRCVAFSPDCKLLAYCGDDKLVHLYDPVNGTDRELKGHAAIVMAVAWSPDGRMVASEDSDGVIRLWDAAGNELGNLAGEPCRPKALAFSPDGATLAASSGGNVKLWDLAKRKVTLSIRPGGREHWLMFSPDGQFLATGAATGAVELWDTATGTQKTPMLPDTPTTYCIGIAPDGRNLAATRGDGLHLVDIATRTGKLVAPKPPGGTLDWPLTYDPAGRLITAGMANLQILDSAGKTTNTWKLPWTTDALALAADGRHLAMMGRETIYIMRLPAPK
jgi:WD40 repeat protein